VIGTLFLIHNERPEVTSCPKMLSIKAQVEKGFPQTFKVKGGGQEE